MYSSADGTWKGGMYVSVFMCEVSVQILCTQYSETISHPVIIREEQIWYVHCLMQYLLSILSELEHLHVFPLNLNVKKNHIKSRN